MFAWRRHALLAFFAPVLFLAFARSAHAGQCFEVFQGTPKPLGFRIHRLGAEITAVDARSSSNDQIVEMFPASKPVRPRTQLIRAFDAITTIEQTGRADTAAETLALGQNLLSEFESIQRGFERRYSFLLEPGKTARLTVRRNLDGSFSSAWTLDSASSGLGFSRAESASLQARMSVLNLGEAVTTALWAFRQTAILAELKRRWPMSLEIEPWSKVIGTGKTPYEFAESMLRYTAPLWSYSLLSGLANRSEVGVDLIESKMVKDAIRYMAQYGLRFGVYRRGDGRYVAEIHHQTAARAYEHLPIGAYDHKFVELLREQMDRHGLVFDGLQWKSKSTGTVMREMAAKAAARVQPAAPAAATAAEAKPQSGGVAIEAYTSGGSARPRAFSPGMLDWMMEMAVLRPEMAPQLFADILREDLLLGGGLYILVRDAQSLVSRIVVRRNLDRSWGISKSQPAPYSGFERERGLVFNSELVQLEKKKPLEETTKELVEMLRAFRRQHIQDSLNSDPRAPRSIVQGMQLILPGGEWLEAPILEPLLLGYGLRYTTAEGLVQVAVPPVRSPRDRKLLGAIVALADLKKKFWTADDGFGFDGQELMGNYLMRRRPTKDVDGFILGLYAELERAGLVFDGKTWQQRASSSSAQAATANTPARNMKVEAHIMDGIEAGSFYRLRADLVEDLVRPALTGTPGNLAVVLASVIPLGRELRFIVVDALDRHIRIVVRQNFDRSWSLSQLTVLATDGGVGARLVGDERLQLEAHRSSLRVASQLGSILRNLNLLPR